MNKSTLMERLLALVGAAVAEHIDKVQFHARVAGESCTALEAEAQAASLVAYRALRQQASNIERQVDLEAELRAVNAPGGSA